MILGDQHFGRVLLGCQLGKFGDDASLDIIRNFGVRVVQMDLLILAEFALQNSWLRPGQDNEFQLWPCLLPAFDKQFPNSIEKLLERFIFTFIQTIQNTENLERRVPLK